MDTYQPSTYLLALLDHVGLRNFELAAHLGVSRTLVSLWRSGHKPIPAGHHAALTAFATHTAWTRLQAEGAPLFAQTPLPQDAVWQHMQAVGTLKELASAAQAERDPALLATRLQTALYCLEGFAAQHATPESWDTESLTYVETQAQQIVTTTRLLRTYGGVVEDTLLQRVEGLLAQLTAYIGELTRQRWPRPRTP
jgi:hypothetical protein